MLRNITELRPQADTRRLAALPAFQPADALGPGGKAAALAKAPLEPRLAQLRDQMTAQAAAQLRSADELLEALQVNLLHIRVVQSYLFKVTYSTSRPVLETKRWCHCWQSLVFQLVVDVEPEQKHAPAEQRI